MMSELRNRVLSIIMAASVILSMLPVDAVAAEEELPMDILAEHSGEDSAATEVLPENAQEKVTYSGKVLMAVSTQLSDDTSYFGSFSSMVQADDPNSRKEIAQGIYAVETDAQTGEEYVVMEPEVEWLEPIGFSDPDVSAIGPDLASYSVGNTRSILDCSQSPSNRTMQCLYVGAHCTVWGSTSDPSAVVIGNSIAASVGQQFDRYYPSVVNAFGGAYDTDGDGKVAILCYDIDNNYRNNTGGTYVAGTFRMRDMVNSSGHVNGVNYGASAYTIGMDAIHLDTYPCMGGSSNPLGDVENAYSTLVHEFQHMINYSWQVANGASNYVEYMETYLNEAFAMAAEHMICGADSCEDRVNYFSGSDYYPGTALTYWANGDLSRYANSYLFGQYLRTRYGAQTSTDGNTLFKRVFSARTPANEGDTLGVVANILNTTPMQLVTDFWTAVYLKQSTGVHGFAGEDWAGDIKPYVYGSTSLGNTGIGNGSAKYYTLSGTFSPNSLSNVELVSLGDSGIVDQDLPLAVSDVSVDRHSASGAMFSVTSTQDAYLFYQVSDSVISNRDDLQDFVAIQKNVPMTLELSISGGEATEPSVYYFLMNDNGDATPLESIPIPAYTYPITIESSDRGTVEVTCQGVAVSSGDRVVNGKTLVITATPHAGFELTAIQVDGAELSGTELKVTGSHVISAVFTRSDVAGADRFAAGSGTEADPFVISNAGELKYFAQRVNDGDTMEGMCIVLSADLDLEGCKMAPIGSTSSTPFAGHFNGQNYKLLNLTITMEDVSYGGVFGYLTGTVTRLHLVNQNLTINSSTVATGYVGGLAGYNDGEISACTAEKYLTVDGYKTLYAGGLCGYNAGSILDCFSLVHTSAQDSGAIAVRYYVGGIAGRNTGTVIGCESQGAARVSTESANCTVYRGGLLGYNSGTIKACITTNADMNFVSGTLYAGGAVGYQSGGNVTGCVVYAPAWSLSSYGDSKTYTGGLIGYLSSGTVESCAVTLKKVLSQAVYGNSSTNYMGPVLGYGSGAVNCYYNSDITLTALTSATRNYVGTSTSASNLLRQTYLSATVGLDFVNDWDLGKKPDVEYPTPTGQRRLFGIPMKVVQPEHATISMYPWAYMGMTVDVSVTPEEGYYTEAVLVDGEAITGTSFVAAEAHTISAQIGKYCKITVEQPEHATITVDTVYALPGDTVTVTVESETGYSAVCLLVDDVPVNGWTFTVTGDHTVAAAIEADYVITVVQSEYGTISLSTTAQITQMSVPAGSTVHVAVTSASEGYGCAGLLVDGQYTSQRAFVPDGDCTVTPVFEQFTSYGSISGTNIYWGYLPDNTLIVGGSGAIGTYSTSRVNYTHSGYGEIYVTNAPWRSFWDTAQTIRIEEGITAVGDSAFKDIRALYLYLPDSLTSVGNYAFYYSGNYRNLMAVVPHGASVKAASFTGRDVYSPDNVVILSVLGVEPTRKTTEGYRIKNSTIKPSPSCFKVDSGYQVKCITANSLPVTGETIMLDRDVTLRATTEMVRPDTVVIEGGACGNSSYANWFLTDADELVIYGSGSMPNYTSETSVPWAHLLEQIRTVSIEKGITYIGNYAFYGCSNLTSVTIPEGVTGIGQYAFYGCTSLTSVWLPDGLTSVQKYALYDVKDVIIPGSVTTIYEYAFSSALEHVYYVGTPEQWEALPKNIGYYSYDWAKNATVHFAEHRSGIIPITVEIVENGSATLPRFGVKGEQMIAEITPASDYGLASMTVNGTVRGLPIFTVPDADEVTVEVLFAPLDNGAVLIGSGFCGKEHLKDIFWYLNVDGELVMMGSGPMRDYGNYDYSPWYKNRAQITSVTIGDGITSIGGYAFDYCYAMKSVHIPEGVTDINWYAFQDCSALTSVVIPDGVTTIGVRAFEGCSSMTSVVIPDGVTSIGSYAFCSCRSLTSVTIPEGVTSIGSFTFGYCSSLATLDIPSTVTSIEGSALSGCSKLTKIQVSKNSTSFVGGEYLYRTDGTLCWWTPTAKGNAVVPNGVTVIGGYAFDGCTGLTSVDIPDGVTSIGGYAFYGCTGLRSVGIPDGVTSIGAYAFSGCRALTSAVIPDGVTSIGDDTFRNCSALTTVVIPGSVTSVGVCAFQSCNSLTDVYYVGTEAQWAEISIERENTCLTNATIHYIDSSSMLVPIRVSASEGGAIALSAGAAPVGTEITVRYAVELGYGISKLFVNGVEQSSIASFVVPDVAVVTVSAVFEALRPGETLVTGGTCGETAYWFLTEAGELVIHGSGDMQNYSSSSTNWAPWRQNRAQITSVTIEDRITSVGSYAFYDCTALLEVTMPQGLISIGKDAFYNCAMTDADIPETVTTIGDAAFYYCRALTAVTIPKGVAKISNSTFYGCTALTVVIIPDTVTSIGNSAFYNCIALTDLYYTGTEESWNAITIGSYNSLSKARCHFIESLSDIALVTAGPCANGTVSAQYYAAKGETIPVSVVPDPGYQMRKLLVNGVEQSGIDSFVVPSGGEITVSAVFEVLRPGESVVTGGTCGENVFWFLTEAGELVIHGNGAMKDGTAPWNGKRDQIKTVTIEEGVTSIGNNAFSQCSVLTSVAIPVSVTAIGENAFYECGSLTSVTIPESVTTISRYAFAYCRGLGCIVVPGSVTTVESYAFYECSGMSDAFYVGSSGAWSAVSVASGNTPLTNARLHFIEDVSDIAFVTADDCSGGKVIVQAYAAKGELINVTVTPDPGYRQTKLLVNGVEQNNLDSFLLPKGGTILVSAEFEALRPDQSAVSGGTCGENVFWILTEAGELVIHGSGAMKDYSYSGNVPWYGLTDRIETVTVEPGVTTIGSTAFYNCKNLTSVTIPKGVSAIGNHAFYGCSILISVDIPEGITTIGKYAFAYCSSLTSVTIPDGVLEIGDSVFRECKALVSVTIPGSVKKIGDSAFYNCSKLTSATIPESVMSIGEYAFYGASITEMTIFAAVTEIGEGAFSYCSNLSAITVARENPYFVGGSFLYRKGGAFLWCAQKQQGTFLLPQGIASIGASAFSSCSKLTAIRLPSTVTAIGNSAFSNCYSMAYAFYDGTQEQWSTVTVGTSNTLLTGRLVFGIPVSMTTEGISSYYYPGQTVSVTSAVITLSSGNTITVTNNLQVDYDFTGVGEHTITVSWNDLVSQTVFVTVYEGGVIKPESINSDTATVEIHAQQDGNAVVAFYDTDGRMITVRLYPVKSGYTKITIGQEGVDLTTCTWKILLVKNDYTPQCEDFSPEDDTP